MGNNYPPFLFHTSSIPAFYIPSVLIEYFDRDTHSHIFSEIINKEIKPFSITNNEVLESEQRFMI